MQHVIPSLLKNDDTFTFEVVPTMPNGFVDVIYKGERIAIINGLSAPLQWTAKIGYYIPNYVIDQLENIVREAIEKTAEIMQKRKEFSAKHLVTGVEEHERLIRVHPDEREVIAPDELYIPGVDSLIERTGRGYVSSDGLTFDPIYGGFSYTITRD